jgi:hypothetical protein
MISQRIRVVAAVGLVLGLALGGVQVVSAQFGGGVRRPVADESQLASIVMGSLIAVETPGKDGVKVYNVDEGTWSEYRAPKGTRARPVGGGNYVAIMPEGPRITQLAAYTRAAGWVTLDLPEPVEGKLWGPVYGPFGPVYAAGRRVFAFSAMASKWGVLELPEGAEPRPTLSPQYATLIHGDRLYVFNPKFARWDDSGDKPK